MEKVPKGGSLVLHGAEETCPEVAGSSSYCSIDGTGETFGDELESGGLHGQEWSHYVAEEVGSLTFGSKEFAQHPGHHEPVLQL